MPNMPKSQKVSNFLEEDKNELDFQVSISLSHFL